MKKVTIAFLFTIFSFNCFAQNSFTLSSSDITEGGLIDKNFTCTGKDVSPQLSWSYAPDKTKSYALFVTDIDAYRGIFYHWVVYQIPTKYTSFNQDITLPSGIAVAKNSWNLQKYSGPCPPKGQAHHYTFTMYALSTFLNLKNASAEEVMKAMQQHILAYSTITVIFHST